MFSDLALSRRLERAEGLACAGFVEARAAVTPEAGATFIEVDGALAMFDGATSPLTQSFGLGFQGSTESSLTRIEEFFRERLAPIYHEVSPLADPALFALFHARGYAIAEFTSVLWRELRQDDRLAARHGRVTARPAAANEHGVWAQTAARGWNQPELNDFMLGLEHLNAHRPGHVPFLAEVDGRIIAAASLVIADGIAILAGGSTLPEARRQGAQNALLEARLAHAAGEGCDLAMMGALPGSDSQRNAERQGFRIAYTRSKWRLPEPGDRRA